MRAFVLIGLVLLVSCRSEIKKNDIQLFEKEKLIIDEILDANMRAVVNAYKKSPLLNHPLVENDTILIDTGTLGLSFYGTDSLNGKYKLIDSTNYLVYQYQNNHSYFFKIYNKKGNRFIDKGGITKESFLNLMFPDENDDKINFFNAYQNTIDYEYERIKRKYSISKKYIDSLISVRMSNPPR